MFLKVFTNYASVDGKPETASLTAEYVAVDRIVRLSPQSDGWARVGLIAWNDVYVPVTPDELARCLGILGDVIAPMSVGKLPEY